MTNHDLLRRIDRNLSYIRERRPLSPQEGKELDAYYKIGTTYSSNALGEYLDHLGDQGHFRGRPHRWRKADPGLL